MIVSCTPKVMCEDNDLALDIVTEKPFQGNIFVKSIPLGKASNLSWTSANLIYNVDLIMSKSDFFKALAKMS
ncbi:hypothetical protein ANCCEY_04478 [Ancylostoma ceylanicum]|uniref:Uncharacterized protein n=1 Tax=Ancylostoma ceylanicum TaxID=53326 RepID=A0A0D6LWJ9_9BILA|nr:hypothetical protein ANCCEY_04478 [Ancylostoma ceylanicum]